MAFTRTLMVLVALSLAEFQTTSGSNFRRPSTIPAEIQAQIDEFMSTNTEAQLALNAVRGSSNVPSKFSGIPHPCDCKSRCYSKQVPVTSPSVTPPGALACYILFPSALTTVECLYEGLSCTEVKTCGAPPPATCQAVGGGMVQVFSVCVAPFPNLISFQTTMEHYTSNCCCTEQ